jgi:hypothetical protein
MRKTGGTSIESALGDSDNFRFNNDESFQKNFNILKGRILRPFSSDKHSSLREYYKNLDRDFFNQLTIVSTTRNPWNRMISMYFWLKQKNGVDLSNSDAMLFEKRKFIDLVKKMNTLEGYVCSRSWHRKFPINKIINPIKLSPVQKYLRQENLQADYNELCSNVGIESVNLESLNTSSYSNWKSYYDEECINIVRNKFINEINYFSYKFE